MLGKSKSLFFWMGCMVLLVCSSAQAQSITGQWDFSSGDLSATIGSAMQYLDGPGGSTDTGTAFGTAGSFGLPLVGGQDKQVMKVPACSSTMGYLMDSGANANGGGSYVNNYTIIMDVYLPSSVNKLEYKALFNTSNTNGNDADFFFHYTTGVHNGIGIMSEYHGMVNYDTWHRIGCAVSCTAGQTIIKKYINGTLVGTLTTTSSGLDGRWSLNPTGSGYYTLLFTDNDDETATLYSSFVEIRDYVITDMEARAMGGPNGSIGFLVPPYLQNVSETGISVMWDINYDAAAILEYGTTTAYGSSTACTSTNSGVGIYIHKAVLSGLIANTTYHCRPVINGSPAADLTFTTSPDSNVDFSFGFWSDSQGEVSGGSDPYEPTISIFKDMVNAGVSFAVSGGDMQEDADNTQDVLNYFLSRVCNNVGQHIPYFITWGNHDNYAVNLPRLHADQPSKDRSGFSPGLGSYSFNYAGCHFISIDEADQSAITDGWLEADLQSTASSSARFRFLFVHRPPYCEMWIDGTANLRTDLVPLLETYKVNVCFSGHTHEYERGLQNGVYYIIAGGSSWLEDSGSVSLITDWPFITVGGYNTMPGATLGGLLHHYILVSISAEQCTLTMKSFNADGIYIGDGDTVTLNSSVENYWKLF